MASLSYAQLIRGNRNFRNLLWGQLISELGNWFNFIAALGVIRAVSGASAEAAGIFILCRTLPFSLLIPFAGTLVDRFSRRKIMIYSDLARVLVALIFLLVTSREKLWLAFLATALLSFFGAFFEAGKNAATANIAGSDGLFSATALMFSSRFLLMAIGAGLGGWASAYVGYEIAFVINAASFLVSAFTIWLIPEEAVRETAKSPSEIESFTTQLAEGWKYFWRDPFVFTIVMMNIVWATGGGAINIVFERMGGVAFANLESWKPDLAVALLWVASGAGLFIGMMLARRVEMLLAPRKWTIQFIGWSLIIHGILFSIGGLMPTLYGFIFFVFISRALIGIEYAIQDTWLQRVLPDRIRGRILTIDRGAEITMFSVSGYFAGLSQNYISPTSLTIAAGILSATSGVFWFVSQRKISEASMGAESQREN